MLMKKQEKFPNYEARVLSIILVVIKLLFGLDGLTEIEFSKYARLCNEKQSEKMFNIEKWLKYLNYRKFFINMHHFSTQLGNNPKEVDSDLFLEYISTKPKQYDENQKLIKYMEDYKELLTKLNAMQDDFSTPLEFPHSLTPFKDYTVVLLNCFKLQKSKYNRELLNSDFSGNGLDFLLEPNHYLNVLNVETTIEGGVNKNIQLIDIKNEVVENHMKKKKDRKNLVTVQLKTQDNNLQIFKPKNVNSEKMPKIQLSDNSYPNHFEPCKKYWVNYFKNPDKMSQHRFELFFNKFPKSFKTIFSECVRISEQGIQEFFFEFQLTEAYLVYLAKYKPNNKPPRIVKLKLKHIVTMAKRNW